MGKPVLSGKCLCKAECLLLSALLVRCLVFSLRTFHPGPFIKSRKLSLKTRGCDKIDSVFFQIRKILAYRVHEAVHDGRWRSTQALVSSFVNLLTSAYWVQLNFNQHSLFNSRSSAALLRADFFTLTTSCYHNFQLCSTIWPASAMLKVLDAILILVLLIAQERQSRKMELR